MGSIYLYVALQLALTAAATIQSKDWNMFASCKSRESSPKITINMRQKVGHRYGFTAPLHVTVEAEGATIRPGKHGLHVHTYGVTGTGDTCLEAGGHYNPLNTKHGDIRDLFIRRHVGDWGNVLAAGGKVNVTFQDTLASLFGRFSILGRAIVLHDGEDDLGRGGDAASVANGNAGRRLVCCTVAVADGSAFN